MLPFCLWKEDIKVCDITKNFVKTDSYTSHKEPTACASCAELTASNERVYTRFVSEFFMCAEVHLPFFFYLESRQLIIQFCLSVPADHFSLEFLRSVFFT